MIVLDCSYALAMVMPDARRPVGMRKAVAGRLFVPSLWTYEMANALRNGMRRGRIDDAQAAAVCAHLESLSIEVIASADANVRQRLVAAQTHELTAYDAAYVELALQQRSALATLDAGLARVAHRVGIALIQ